MNRLMRMLFIAAGAVGLAGGPAGAVSGAAFTTFNSHVDGSTKDVCKNSAINCNLYGAKEYVWLNGGPTANGLGPDGEYFFAVLVPGGQPNPNDGGPKNLSDDYDCYHNRTFTVTDGEVSFYDGDDGPGDVQCGLEYPFQQKHWLDSGKGGPKPNWDVPLIRLFPYADTWNPGGVYIMAICSLAEGYPVDPRDCKYDAFKVKKGKQPVQFRLSGYKFEDANCDGDCGGVMPPDGEEGIPGWTITIDGTGPDGLEIHEMLTTGAGGFWEWDSQEYFFTSKNPPQQVNLTICEAAVDGWNQSCPGGDGCYTIQWDPPTPAYEEFDGLSFGNWRPVTVTVCKERPADAAICECGDDAMAVEGWDVRLTMELPDGTRPTINTGVTGADGCHTFTTDAEGNELICGVSYDVHEASRGGWEECTEPDYIFSGSRSGDALGHTFCNAPLQGCTPGFWQGGSDVSGVGGRQLWNENNDPDWGASGGYGTNPYVWGTLFNDFFTPYSGLAGFTMMDLVGTGGGPDDFQKAARSLVAAYLNASWGINYAYTTGQLVTMWNDAVAGGDFLSLHTELDAANNAYYRGEGDGGPRCPISGSGW